MKRTVLTSICFALFTAFTSKSGAEIQIHEKYRVRVVYAIDGLMLKCKINGKSGLYVLSPTGSGIFINDKSGSLVKTKNVVLTLGSFSRKVSAKVAHSEWLSLKNIDGIIGFDEFKGQALIIDTGKDYIQSISSQSEISDVEKHLFKDNPGRTEIQIPFKLLSDGRVVANAVKGGVKFKVELLTAGPCFLNLNGFSDLITIHAPSINVDGRSADNSIIGSYSINGLQIPPQRYFLDTEDILDKAVSHANVGVNILGIGGTKYLIDLRNNNLFIQEDTQDNVNTKTIQHILQLPLKIAGEKILVFKGGDLDNESIPSRIDGAIVESIGGIESNLIVEALVNGVNQNKILKMLAGFLKDGFKMNVIKSGIETEVTVQRT